jgi:hypothetical protein
MSNELESTERAVEVNLGEDDVLVVKAKGRISNEHADRIYHHLEGILGKRGNQIILLGDDLELVVLHRELPAIKEINS